MGTLLISIPDNVEAKFRQFVKKRHGREKGNMSFEIVNAIAYYMDREKQT